MSFYIYRYFYTVLKLWIFYDTIWVLEPTSWGSSNTFTNLQYWSIRATESIGTECESGWRRESTPFYIFRRTVQNIPTLYKIFYITFQQKFSFTPSRVCCSLQQNKVHFQFNYFQFIYQIYVTVCLYLAYEKCKFYKIRATNMNDWDKTPNIKRYIDNRI